MQERSDAQLLRDYAGRGDEGAFREIVRRHGDLVYSAALRQLDSPDLGADIAQGVFVDLARKAKSVGDRLPADASLVGWLFRSTRYAALNQLRDDRRRTAHERNAMEQLLTNAESAPDWQHLRPLLDEAIAALSEEDHDALLLRYFENRDFRAVGLALGVSDDAAQKRVSRAVERLREFLAQRGVTAGAASLAAAISANAVQAAPAGLVVTISSAAILAGTAIVPTATVAITKAIAMTTLQKTIVTATVAVLAGAGLYEAHEASQLRAENQTLQQQQAPLAAQVETLKHENEEATNRLASLRNENDRLNQNTAELLRLRGMAGVARRANLEAENLRAQLARQPIESGSNLVTGAMADAMGRAVQQQTEGRLSRMTASLNLTPEQVQAAREILKRQAEAMSAGMQQALSGKFDRNELTRLGKAAGNPDDQIKALLMPAQLAAYPHYRQEEDAYSARMAVNAELLQLQTLDLTPEQQDQAFAALYETTINQLAGAPKPTATNQADVMLWLLEQKAKALEPILTPVQMESYRQQQAIQAKLVKDLLNKMDASGSTAE